MYEQPLGYWVLVFNKRAKGVVPSHCQEGGFSRIDAVQKKNPPR